MEVCVLAPDQPFFPNFIDSLNVEGTFFEEVEEDDPNDGNVIFNEV